MGTRRNGDYTERELEERRHTISAWRTRVEVFAYFNNDWEGFAVRNVLWLDQHLPDP